ncbi:protein yippee-like At3g11230 [Brassica napus]|nr:protein yippee-like At3g11230 [Brassica napus]
MAREIQEGMILHEKTDIAICDDVVSKIFQSRYGKSYLFSKVANVYAEKKENRMMMTGLHTVADIYFVKCGSYVGWRYEFAFEKNQLYKEGKSILERYKIWCPDENN